MRIAVPSDYPPFAIVDGDSVEGFVVDLGTLAAEALGVERRVHPGPERRAAWTSWTLTPSTPRGHGGGPRLPHDPDHRGAREALHLHRPLLGGPRAQLEGDASQPDFAHCTDVELLTVAYRTPGLKITGEEHSTEGYGAAVRTGAATFATLVSQVFNEADAEGDWSEFYEQWLAEYFAEPDPSNVPIMSVEDAAALYPTELE